MQKAIYAGSFDPVTYGHLDIIERGATMTDELIVAVGINPDKDYTFTLEERQSMLEQAVSYLPNVRVMSFTGLLVKFAYEQNIPFIIRGIRDPESFQSEYHLTLVNKSQQMGIETIFLPTKTEKSHISSSFAKALQRDQGNIYQYVPLNVKAALEARLSGQYFIGITGTSGVGKSFIARRLQAEAKKRKIPFHHVDLDKIGHEIYEDTEKPVHTEIQEKIKTVFGASVIKADGTIHRKNLGKIVFQDLEKLEALNQIMHQPIITRMKDQVFGKKGIILLDAALLAESEITHLVNHHVILIEAKKSVIRERLEARDHLDAQQIKRRLESQLSTKLKREKISASIDADHFGQLLEVDNSRVLSDIEMENLFDRIMELLNVRMNS